MNTLTLTLAWLFGVLAVSVGVRLWRINSRVQPRWRILLTAGVAYMFLLVAFEAYEWYLDARLDAFDLNNDGVFDLQEMTPLQQEVFKLITNDSGRNMMRLFGFPAFLLASVCAEFIGWLRLLVKFSG